MPQSFDEIRLLMDTAEGKAPATLKIVNGNIVDVVTGSVYQEDIIIANKYIVAIGNGNNYPAIKEVNARGQYIVPGLIDPHFNIETGLLLPHQLYKRLLLHGTTTIFLDVSSVVTVLGYNGVKLMKALSENIPLRTYFYAPIELPRFKAREESDATFDKAALERLLEYDKALHVTHQEVSDILAREPRIIEKLKLAHTLKKKVFGSLLEIPFEELFAYSLSGIDIITCPDENVAIKMLKAGFHLILENMWNENKVGKILRSIKYHIKDFRNFSLAMGMKRIIDIFKEEGLDATVRAAIGSGLDPVVALQMATINSAKFFGIDNLVGSINVGKYADILIVDSVRTFNVRDVIFNGQVVVERGILTLENRKSEEKTIPLWATNTINIKRSISDDELILQVDKRYTKGLITTMFLSGSSIYNKKENVEVKIKDGKIAPTSKQDVIFIAVIDRYSDAREIGKGFISGIGLKHGAFASTLLYPQYDIVVVGDRIRDMKKALNEVIKMNGGISVVSRGKVIAKLQLNFAGILTSETPENTLNKYKDILRYLQKMGCTLDDPIFQIALTCTETTQELGLTSKGLIDVKTKQIINPIVELYE
ncbi:MAG: adenine deaminase C-terminal domain-containing protein [Candidatus Asgardarchaeia archaeon]